MAQFNERACKIALARKSFWDYCRLFAPDFYKDDRTYLRYVCDALQGFYEGEEELLIWAAPPRHGKSRTATNLTQWVFGKYVNDKVVSGSYNETLSTVSSKTVRNKIQEIPADGGIVYHEVFPNTRIKRGDAAANLWGLEGNETNSYLATSPNGTVTGFGADLIIVDDLIKNEYEARNASIKEAHWRWFNDTMMSRREGKRKVIIIMTRWATDDLAGKLIEDCEKRGKKYIYIKNEVRKDGKMLCDEILNSEQFDAILNSDMGRDIVEANYNQSPVDMVGRLYTELKEYDEAPENIQSVDAYYDTADQGDDYLCGLIYDVKDADAFTKHVQYTQEPMEQTEDEAARLLTVFDVNTCRIESNNGGRGWGRNVKRIAKEKYGNTKTRFIFFTQSKNKESRILTGCTGVMNRVHFPKGWQVAFPEYARDMKRYQRTGKNAHDDAQDATTGVYEYLPNKRKESSGNYVW